MKRKLLLTTLVGLFFLLPVSAQIKKDEAKAKEKYNLVKEGKGMEGITVGKSKMDDVIKKFGKDYKWVINKKYSFQMTYQNGLSFYMCQSDKKKQVFVIEVRPPYKAQTSRGIIIGKSTLDDVHKAYGKLKSGTEYRGISFYYRTIGGKGKNDGKNIVTSMDITENSGIRQCKEAK